MAELPFLDTNEVAQILGEERERKRQIKAGVPEDEIDVSDATPLSLKSVLEYIYSTRHGRRQQFVTHPFPMPQYRRGGDEPLPGEHPFWPAGPDETVEHVRERFRVWYRTRPGEGAGGGRPRKNPTDPDRPMTDGELASDAFQQTRRGTRESRDG